MLESKPQFLYSAKLIAEVGGMNGHPFDLPIVKGFHSLEFHPRVTFLVGENGVGKSTLIEAIATAWGFNPEGGSKNFNFATSKSVVPLAEHIKLVKSYRRPEDGFFLRAEAFFNLATEIDYRDEEPGPPPIIDSYGGVSLHHQSHGESFFSLMVNRFGGEGLYILDEPEAALSPTRQLAMLARIHELVNEGSQFIIATHSPILMSYPDAKLMLLSEDGIEEVAYEDTEHYLVMKSFLNNPKAALQRLFEK